MIEHHVLISIAAILVLGIGAQWLAWRLRLPSILLLLLFGFLVGPFTGFLHPDELLGELLFPAVSLSVGIILFEGGLSLRIAELQQIGRVLRNLITIGALVTWLISAAGAYLVLGLNLGLSLLLGAILVVTGPTVILPLLRHIQPVRRISSILKWEGIVIDPIGATLAVLIFEAVRAGDVGAAAGLVVLGVFKTLIVGAVLGLFGAAVIVVLLRHYWVPDYLHNTVALMVVVLVFTLSDLLQKEAGLLTVTVMGVALANQKYASIRHIVEFKENLRTLLLAFLFILLAARLELGDLTRISGAGLAFLAVLILVARPLTVLVSALGSSLNWRERLLLAWMAPRGIVAAAVASVFGLDLAAAGYPQAEQLAPIIFLVIIGTVTIYGLTAGPLARRLNLSQQNPQGVLIMGADSVARAIGQTLRQEGYQVRLVDTNWSNISAARMAGLPTHYGSILSEETLETVDLIGIGRLLALTPNNEANSLAAVHFIETFGRAEVYQLSPGSNGSGPSAETTPHLRGRYLFGPDITHSYLAGRLAAGATLKVTSLTREFDYSEFQSLYGESVTPLFIINEARQLVVATVSIPLAPRTGHTLISLFDSTD